MAAEETASAATAPLIAMVETHREMLGRIEKQVAVLNAQLNGGGHGVDKLENVPEPVYDGLRENMQRCTALGEAIERRLDGLQNTLR